MYVLQLKGTTNFQSVVYHNLDNLSEEKRKHLLNETTKKRYHNGCYGPFTTLMEAKIFKNKERIKYLNKKKEKMKNDFIKQKNYKDAYKSLEGEIEHLRKWILDKIEKYPEYFI